MHSQPASPGPTYSDAGSTGRGGFGLLDSLKKGLGASSSPRPHSPASSMAGSDAGTPPSRSKLGFPSFSNGQRKREIIKKLEEDMSLLQMQLHHRESELVQLQQQAAAEQAARVDAQERLNMQYFKSHLLADMLVAKLLDLEGAAAGGSAVVHVVGQQPAAAAVQKAAVAAAEARSQRQPQQLVAVMAESSFD